MKKIIDFILKKKYLFITIFAVLCGIGYFVWPKLFAQSAKTQYTLSAVENGAIISTVSGSGQVSVTNQVDIKPNASAKVLAVNVKKGQEVKEGDILIQLDSKEGNKAVRDAQINLNSAEISLEKIKKPADEYAVLQAEIALESAQDSLEKLKAPADSSSVTQAENALTNAQNTLDKLELTQSSEYEKSQQAVKTAETNLDNSYEDALNTVSNVFLDMPGIIENLDSVLYSYDIGESEPSLSKNQDNTSVLMSAIDLESRDSMRIYQSAAQNDYKSARENYDANFLDYKNATRYSDSATIDSLLTETLETTKSIAQAAKSESDYLGSWSDLRQQKDFQVYAKVTEYQDDLGTYINQINSNLSSLLSAQKSLDDNEDAKTTAEKDLENMDLTNPLDLAAAQASVDEKEVALEDLKAGADPLDIKSAEATVEEKEAALEDLKAGADPLDIAAQENAVEQRKNDLLDAQEQLADYVITAPFDGIIASVDIAKADIASSGTSVCTIITKQNLAEIPFNEVDVAKIAVNQKATFTFDAISDLSISGQVAEIDSLGTVSQGVVTYNVKILFDTQDDRIKSGMSTSVSIITDMKQDVLTVPNAAVKADGNGSYVETFDNINSADTTLSTDVLPKQVTVETGISNDSLTEIKSGLQSGDKIVVKSASATAAATKTSSATNIFQMGGGPGRQIRD